MRKASKILVLILVVVMLFGVFSGCALIGKNLSKYRSATAIKVGNESISVGKLLDTFNSYYNSWYYYISAGYMTLDQLVESAVSSLYSQYVKVDKYVTTHDGDANANDFVGVYHNAEYLTEDEMAYVIKYVKYIVFQTFDNNVEENLSAKHDLKDAETEDTSREFAKPDDLYGAETYAEYSYKSNYVDEDMDEYFADYYPNLSLDATIDYVYTDDNKADADKKLSEYNDRLEDDSDEITFEEYVKAQKDVVELYSNSIKTAYGQELDAFIEYEIEDMIATCIVNKYNYEVYKTLEEDGDIFAKLADEYEEIRKAKQAEFAVGDNFKNFIEGLSSSSYIYDVPAKYQDQYVFVKNILIPFNNAQKNLLTVVANQLGDSKRETPEYVKQREALAADIVADDFNSTKDDDGKYEQVKNIFKYENGKVIIDSENELFGSIFGADGEVTKRAEDDKAEDTIKYLMERFNTDAGQHSAQYDYVVYVGDDEDYDHPWVDTFWQATQELMTTYGESGIGKYTLAVSDYGVHIIYVVDYVKAEELNFSQNYLISTSPEYRLFAKYFETCSSDLLSEDYEALFEEYVKANKISATNTLKKFLKENGLDSFDFDKSLEIDD